MQRPKHSACLMLLAASVLFVPVPAGAREAITDLSTKETRAMSHAYAQCVVKRQPKRASEAIRLNVDNATIMRNYRQLIIGDCLRQKPGQVMQASFTGDLYRYTLADALVARDLAGFDATDFSGVARLDHRDPGEPPAQTGPKGKKLNAKKYQEALDGYEQAKAFAYLSRYGECVVRNAPAGAKALLLTTPDSGEETAGFKALNLALGTCLPEGETLKFGRTALRGTIAINYYRLAMAARPAATGTAG